jgi:hypothetical protein
VVEEKHMGSRALLVVCRDEAAARDRFGVTTAETGAVYTRTGRAFFQDRTTTEAVLARVRAAMTEVGFDHPPDQFAPKPCSPVHGEKRLRDGAWFGGLPLFTIRYCFSWNLLVCYQDSWQGTAFHGPRCEEAFFTGC